MELSLSRNDLLHYTSRQLNHFYPDNKQVNLGSMPAVADMALDRLHFCFKHVAFNRYCNEGKTLFNHLYADHYLMYVWFLANTIWKEKEDTSIANKLYYLNKSLHGFDCMYETRLPAIFLIFHGVGTMLGKAEYNDFFVTLQGCTVGSNKGKYPVFGKGVALTANSSVVGNCNIGNRSTISTRTMVFEKNIPDDSTAFVNTATGINEIRRSRNCYAQQFFNVDLNTVT